jgi:hypothetical protein
MTLGLVVHVADWTVDASALESALLLVENPAKDALMHCQTRTQIQRRWSSMYVKMHWKRRHSNRYMERLGQRRLTALCLRPQSGMPASDASSKLATCRYPPVGGVSRWQSRLHCGSAHSGGRRQRGKVQFRRGSTKMGIPLELGRGFWLRMWN